MDFLYCNPKKFYVKQENLSQEKRFQCLVNSKVTFYLICKLLNIQGSCNGGRSLCENNPHVDFHSF